MSIFKKFADYRNYRRTVRELASLDNHQLRDIGVSRFEIRGIARNQVL
jgi:uncharacterized protein YjiS (DUF1127 family)